MKIQFKYQWGGYDYDWFLTPSLFSAARKTYRDDDYGYGIGIGFLFLSGKFN